MGLRALVPNRLLEAAYATGPVRRLFARTAVWRAAGLEGRGELYPAARALLTAWRYLGRDGVGERTPEAVRRLVERACREEGRPAPLAANAFLREYAASPAAAVLRRRYAAYPVEDRVRLRRPRPDGPPDRQGNLMIVKPHDPATGERGAAFVMYTEGIAALPAVFDLPRLAARYALLLEPSWWGYQDARFLPYLGRDAEVVVLAQSRPDFEFIGWLGENLVPVRLGAGDWADPDSFRPREGRERSFDVVMVSAWDPFKRHEVLFRALRRLRRDRGLRLTTALVGYPLRWDAARIGRMLRRYGLEADTRIFERVPHARVAEIVADSKLMVLLSKREGANRAIYESMFCDTPVVVYRHHRGVNLDHVAAEVGRLAGDEDLPEVLAEVLEHRDRFHPRRWALENTGWRLSTERLNALLRERARSRQEPWTRDLEGRKNAPNLGYADPSASGRLAAAYDALKECLAPGA